MKIHCFLFLLTMFAFPAMAADNYFSIVDVDVTDVNAAVAREKAMAQANRTAVNEAAAKFTDSKGMEVVHGLSGEQIMYFIKEATVLEERSSNVRYIAQLKVTVQNDVLRQYLQEKGLSEYGNANEINVIYLFDTLSDWLATERKMKTIAAIENIKIIGMTFRKAQFKLEYSGSLENLEESMRLMHLNMQRNGNIYVLTSPIKETEED